MKKTLAVASVLLMTLTACGGGDDEQTAKENLRASFAEEDTFDGTTEEQANCIADGIVDELGVDKLKEYELLNDDLEVNKEPGEVEMSEEDADASAEAIIECVDVASLFTAGMDDTEQSLTDEQRECVEGAVDEDAMKEVLSAEFQGEQSNAMDEMTGEIMTCLMGEMPQE